MGANDARTVLIVDADTRKADMLTTAVEAAAPGTAVVRVHGVDGALNRIRRGDIALVLAGCCGATPGARQLPGHLRKTGVEPHPGVVFVVPVGGQEAAELAARQGADAILETPLDLGRLGRLLSLWLPEASSVGTPVESKASVVAVLRERIVNGRFQIAVAPPALHALEVLAARERLPEVRELVDLLTGNPLLAANAMRAANSAGEVERGECRSLVAAVNRLGPRHMTQRLLEIAREQGAPLVHPEIREVMATECALACMAARCAESLSLETGFAGGPSASLAALLANLGRMLVLQLLDRHFPSTALSAQVINSTVNKLALEATVEALRALHFTARTRAIIVGPIAAPEGVFHREMVIADAARWLARSVTGVVPHDAKAIVAMSASVRRLGLGVAAVEAVLARHAGTAAES